MEDIGEKRARIASLGGERVAVFRYDGKISVLSNVCQHQNGPLGEGRIINGCAVCPWHGYEYLPESGQSPPPFTERLPTFRARVENGRVWVHPKPNPPGTPVEPARIEGLAEAESTEDDFYVGYQPAMAAGLARFLRLRLALVLALAAGLAALLAVSQRPFADSVFEFGEITGYEGIVGLDPYPVLAEDGRRLLLVGPGKTGAEPHVRDLEGRGARLEGTAIYRGLLRAVEVVPGSAREAEPAAGVAPVGQAATLGRHTLRGEIVDSKCYLGVMKPGRWKPHRACAVNCIRGGAPPVLVVEDRAGRRGFFLLIDDEGRAVNQRVLDLVAEPVEIRGEVLQRDNLLYLRADPGSYRRLETGS